MAPSKLPSSGLSHLGLTAHLRVADEPESVPSGPLGYRRLITNSIRLIRLVRLENGEYQYSLIHTTLQDAPQYQALSWTWGCPDRIYQLPMVNGGYLRINQNFSQALPYILPFCSTEHLWVDQLCINQDDMEEREAQVLLMGEIYSIAYEVLAWLGIEKEVDQGLGKVFQIAEENDDHFALVKSAGAATFITTAVQPGGVIFEVMAAPWFTRGWVFQEIVLAKRPSFIIGSLKITLRTLAATYYACQMSTQALESFVEQNHPILEMWMNNVVRVRSKPLKIVDILSRVAPSLNTTEARDRLYAYLGLSQGIAKYIKVDYQAPVRNIFVDFAESIIRNLENLCVLETVRRDSHDYEVSFGDGKTLPSWVPDWRRPNNADSLLDIAPIAHYSPNACKGRSHIWINRAQGKLLVQGQIIDIVAETIQPGFKEYQSQREYPKVDVRDDLALDDKLAALRARGYDQMTRSRILELILYNRSGDFEVQWDNIPQFSNAYDQFQLSLLGAPNDSEYTGRLAYMRALQYASIVTYSRSIFVTCNGKLGLARQMQMYDLVCIIHGSCLPVILRQRPSGEYELVDCCYLEGAMEGEAVIWGTEQADQFVLV